MTPALLRVSSLGFDVVVQANPIVGAINLIWFEYLCSLTGAS